MPFCSCGDTKIYYEIHGRGFPLLLIGGLGGGSWSWYGQVPFFERLYTTIIFDNRGAGQSDKPEGPYTMEQLARDALCLLDELGVEQVMVMGLSMGGMIAQELALLAPGKVRAMLLGCTHSGGEERIPPSADVLERLLDTSGANPEEVVRRHLPLFLSEDCMKVNPEVAEAYVKAQLSVPPQPRHAFEAQLAAISSFDTSARLEHLETPTLIVAGSKDILVPRENAYLLSERIRNAQTIIIPGAGHALHAECGYALSSLADNFFQQFMMEGELEETF